MRTRFCENYFLGKGFRKTSADFLVVVSRPQKGVWGMNAGGLLFEFFGYGYGYYRQKLL